MSNDYYDLDDKDLDYKINESKDEYIILCQTQLTMQHKAMEHTKRVIAEKNIYIEQLENRVQVLMGRYSKIEKINPSSQSYKKMKEMLGKMSKEQLQQIKDAKIKFLQYTAGDLLRKMDEDVEIEEEVPTNSAGGGNVAGIGVGPQGEPGVHPKKKKKKLAWEDSRVLMNKFAGKDVFIVDSDMFHDCRMGKKKYHRYEKYVGTKRTGNAIREYGRKFPGRPIILQNGEDGPMLYLRYGRS